MDHLYWFILKFTYPWFCCFQYAFKPIQNFSFQTLYFSILNVFYLSNFHLSTVISPLIMTIFTFKFLNMFYNRYFETNSSIWVIPPSVFYWCFWSLLQNLFLCFFIGLIIFYYMLTPPLNQTETFKSSSSWLLQTFLISWHIQSHLFCIVTWVPTYWHCKIFSLIK